MGDNSRIVKRNLRKASIVKTKLNIIEHRATAHLKNLTFRNPKFLHFMRKMEAVLDQMNSDLNRFMRPLPPLPIDPDCMLTDEDVYDLLNVDFTLDHAEGMPTLEKF